MIKTYFPSIIITLVFVKKASDLVARCTDANLFYHQSHLLKFFIIMKTRVFVEKKNLKTSRVIAGKNFYKLNLNLNYDHDHVFKKNEKNFMIPTLALERR
jgi:hypothetical protein